MNVPRFEIFEGRSPENEVLWRECVQGLEAAVARMKLLATEKPGPYFVFRVVSKEVMASIDTTSYRTAVSGA